MALRRGASRGRSLGLSSTILSDVILLARVHGGTCATLSGGTAPALGRTCAGNMLLLRSLSEGWCLPLRGCLGHGHGPTWERRLGARLGLLSHTHGRCPRHGRRGDRGRLRGRSLAGGTTIPLSCLLLRSLRSCVTWFGTGWTLGRDARLGLDRGQPGLALPALLLLLCRRAVGIPGGWGRARRPRGGCAHLSSAPAACDSNLHKVKLTLSFTQSNYRKKGAVRVCTSKYCNFGIIGDSKTSREAVHFVIHYLCRDHTRWYP